MKLPTVFLEILVTDAREARPAVAAGADRLELVAARDRGRLTLELRVVAEVTASAPLSVTVMLRPHDRGFVCTADERRAIAATAVALRGVGASATVFGALDAHANVDVSAVEDVAIRSHLPLTFTGRSIERAIRVPRTACRARFPPSHAC